MSFTIISQEVYESNKKRLEKQYQKKKEEICKTFDISEEKYDLISEIIKNEQFKANIEKEALEGADQVLGQKQEFIQL